MTASALRFHPRAGISRLLGSVLLGAGLAFAGVAQGTVITFVTPTGSTVTDGAVNASATFTTSADTLAITLSDLLANPKSVGQLISDLEFTLSDTSLTSGTLSSSSAQEVTVNPDQTFTLGGTVDTGWSLTSNGGGAFTLDVLGTAIGPAHLIIGPPGGTTYSNANGSIAENGPQRPHNPFLNQTATFTLSIPGLTDTATITDVTFSFGTTPNAAGSTVTGTPSPSPPPTVPEPRGLALLSLGLLALVFARRKFGQR
jgi:hypothetical protein